MSQETDFAVGSWLTLECGGEVDDTYLTLSEVFLFLTRGFW